MRRSQQSAVTELLSAALDHAKGDNITTHQKVFIEWEYFRARRAATFSVTCSELAYGWDQEITSSAPLWTSRSALALASGDISGPTSVLEASPGPTESDFAFLYERVLPWIYAANEHRC